MGFSMILKCSIFLEKKKSPKNPCPNLKTAKRVYRKNGSSFDRYIYWKSINQSIQANCKYLNFSNINPNSLGGKSRQRVCLKNSCIFSSPLKSCEGSIAFISFIVSYSWANLLYFYFFKILLLIISIL